MNNRLDVLRSLLEEKYKEGEKIHYNEIRIDFESHITELFNNSCIKLSNLGSISKKEYLSSIKSTYYSELFQDLFNKINREKIFPEGYLAELSAHRTTISRFLSGTVGQDETLDYISVSLGYKGYKDLKLQEILKQASEKSVLLQKSKIDSEILRIVGTTIINSSFIARIENKGEISKTVFYSGMQSNDTQFYGVIHQFDIERKKFQDFKNTVHSSFKALNDCYVSAILYGAPGSGKSTFLRRLVIELCKDETFHPTILWLDGGRSVHTFIDSGINLINTKPDQKFLLIIEDWYGMFGSLNKGRIEQFLKDIKSMNNIRVVIGDRTINGRPYKQYFAGVLSDDALQLDNQENKSIIHRIIEGCQEWSETIKNPFEDDKSYQSTLFLLLFIINRIASDVLENAIINPKEPQRAFINIIESDLKVIQDNFPGLAKALYYWSCIYAKQKLFISYNTFLEIADFYNGKDMKIVRNFEDLDRNSPTHEKLRIYITRGVNNRLKFNHDILADFGLSKVSLEELPPLTDIEKIELLDLIIEQEKDTYFASSILTRFIDSEKQIFTHEYELDCIKRLIRKGNNQDYLYRLCSLKLTDNEILFFTKQIIEYKIDFHQFWSLFLLLNLKNRLLLKEIILLLNSPQILEYSTHFINATISFTEECFGNDQLTQQFLRSILINPNWINTNCDIILFSLKRIKNKMVKYQFYKNVFGDPNWKNMNPKILAQCLQFLKSEEKALFLLERWEEYDRKTTATILRTFESMDHLPKNVINVIEVIIENYQSGKTDSILYDYILRINFQSCSKWKIECQHILENWRETSRDRLSVVLFVRSKFPKEIKEVCNAILQEWKLEVMRLQWFVMDNGIHYPNHVEIALGHPDLKKEAKKTAMEMLRTRQNIELRIDDDIVEIAKKIMVDVFPVWK